MALSQLYLALFSIILSLAVKSCGADVAEYGPNPKLDKPLLEKENLLSSIFAVQGLIYCKSPSKLIPLQGAVARITCVGVDENGYETEAVTILSGATDENGYFLATLSPNEVEDKLKIKECKAFLEASPLFKTCNLPTDVNKAITGALLNSYHFLTEKKMKLFTVGPFFFISEPKSVSNNGY